ncbi:thioesterase family protein [Saccharopolyspora sp. NPDC047091]|uniref:acyl-CoA thioesterase n=1 Tax=Saccharopolyspora sp. NPDC047091 TaxID=3155924 RepID=UPI0033F3B3D4
MSDQVQRFRLSYGDCDALSIAYFAIYYPWMERAYSSWLHARGLRSAELAAQLGTGTVGVHSEATYLAPVRVFDELACEVVRDRIGTTSYALGFEFTRDGELVVHGRMTFACRDPQGGKAPVPPRLRELISQLRPGRTGTDEG